MDTTQFQQWFEEYRQKRYLRYATNDELTERLDDISANLTHFTDDGTAVVPTSTEPNPFVILLAHFFEEMKLRGQRRYTFTPKHLHFDDARYPKVRRAAGFWRDRNLKPGSYMLKFGKSIYLEPFLNGGPLRIAPASFYREPSLVAAVRDNELQFDQQLTAGVAKIQAPDGNWRTFQLAGPARLTQTATSDYYLSCFAMLFENRLFDDFDADVCLVIKDIDGFCNRLRDATREVLPEWTCFVGAVQYRDPYVPMKEPNVYFTKSFRYAYQREFRMIWNPPEPKQSLPSIDVKMGDLSAFCELMRL